MLLREAIPIFVPAADRLNDEENSRDDTTRTYDPLLAGYTRFELVLSSLIIPKPLISQLSKKL